MTLDKFNQFELTPAVSPLSTVSGTTQGADGAVTFIQFEVSGGSGGDYSAGELGLTEIVGATAGSWTAETYSTVDDNGTYGVVVWGRV